VVELYNEELSDLIASSDTEAGMLRKLRLLEDPKKGVVLQVLAHVRQSGPYSGACSTVRIIFWYM
jgi:hypothetical protein